MSKPRQAVLLIHGIGEQRPMETLRGFVMGVLGSDIRHDGKRNFYSKPDPNADGFELRRYRAFDGRTDTDFIEFYWQHLMPVAAWQFLFSWLWLLMRRPAAAMPARFVFLWWTCWLVLVAMAGALIATIASSLFGISLPVPSIPKLSGVAALAFGSAGYLVRSFVGDAAIYLNPHPRTVEARNAIRAAGVALLERLQADGRYDRVIVVGHSLGSVIGYDILSFTWHRASEKLRRDVDAGKLPHNPPVQDKLAMAERLADGTDPDFHAKWMQSTRDLHFEQRRLGQCWLVTDFITLGSPLAHASLLLARGSSDLRRRIEEREIPVSPPFREDGAHFSYFREGPKRDGERPSVQVVDHASLFAVTAWTNLYFPCRWLLFGDLVGGRLNHVLGEAIVDVPVTTRVRGGWLAHTEYWTRFSNLDADAAPIKLIAALDLERKGLSRHKVQPDVSAGLNVATSGNTTEPLGAGEDKA